VAWGPRETNGKSDAPELSRVSALPATLWQVKRPLAALEFALAALLVLAHNVWRVVPNEVLILTVVAVLSMRLRAHGWDWSQLGFRRPNSWRRILGIALAAACLRVVVSEFAVIPWAEGVWGAEVAPEGAGSLTGNIPHALLALLLVWTFAAFGEEIAYRGYLLERAAQALGGSTLAFGTAAVISAVLFGFGHFYKGPAGIIDSGIAGLILAGAYLLAGRNLWACVFAHGFIDTFAVAWAYLGLPD
jgi:membrane protease YdiL (CAAX protease family)